VTTCSSSTAGCGPSGRTPGSAATP
jgi:hypothetical protein